MTEVNVSVEEPTSIIEKMRTLNDDEIDTFEKIIKIIYNIEGILSVVFDVKTLMFDEITLCLGSVSKDAIPKLDFTISKRMNSNELVKYVLYKVMIDILNGLFSHLIKDYKQVSKEKGKYNKSVVRKMKSKYDTDCRILIKNKNKIFTKHIRKIVDKTQLYVLLRHQINIKQIMDDYFEHYKETTADDVIDAFTKI